MRTICVLLRALRWRCAAQAALLLLVACSAGPQAPPAAPAEYQPFNDPGNRPHAEVVSGYDVQHYKIELKVDDKTAEVWGRATVTLTLTEDKKDSVAFDASELKFKIVTVAGAPVVFKVKDGRLIAPLGRLAARGEPVTITAEYTFTPRHGLFRITPDEGYPQKPWMVWTQGETEYNRHWFPCWDSPNDKATSEVVATVRAPFTTIANGALVDQKEKDGWRTYTWKQEQPHSSYLVSFIAGDFEIFEEQVELARGKVPLMVAVAKGRYDAADVKRTFAKTAAMVKFFSEKTGVDYPWAKYAQTCVYDFIWGGMENTSCTTLHQYTVIPAKLAQDRDSDGLISHELAHQWFGDLVTCQTWSETWLNEGFATYASALWIEHEQGAEAYADTMAGMFAGALGGDYQRPIVTDRYTDPLDMFDGHSYGKGACVLHMLRSIVGDVVFWKGIHLYLENGSFKNVRTRDLQGAMEHVYGEPLDWFFDQWLFKAAYPEFEVTTSWDETLKTLSVAVAQKQKADDHVALFRMPVEIEIDGRMYLTQVDRAEQTLTFPLDAKPGLVLFDPRGRVLKKLTQSLTVDQLCEILSKSPHVWMRRWAIERLGESKDRAAVPPLKRMLIESKVAGLQIAAAQALGLLDGDALLAALKIENPRVRWAVYEALGNWATRDDVAAVLEKAGYEEQSLNCRATAWTALGKRPDAFAALSKAAEKFADDEVVLPGVLSGLTTQIHPGCLAILASATTYGVHPWIRQRATSALGEWVRRRQSGGAGDGVRRIDVPERDAVVKRLIALVGDPSFRIRGGAVAALKDIGDAAAADAVESQIQRECDGRMIRDMKRAVRKIRETKAP